MNSSLLEFNAAGRPKTLDVAAYPQPYFNGGTPASLLRELVIAPNGVPARFIAGVGYTERGAICTDAAGAIVDYVGGLPITAAGRLAVALDGVIQHYNGGWPFTVANRLVLATPGGFLNLHGFNTGYSQTGFN